MDFFVTINDFKKMTESDGELFFQLDAWILMSSYWNEVDLKVRIT